MTMTSEQAHTRDASIPPRSDEPADNAVFAQIVPAAGRLWLRRLRNPCDIPTIAAWVSQHHARYWGMVGHSLDQIAAAYVDIARSAEVYLGFRDDAPVFLVETYAPHDAPIGAHYPVEPGDRGMHVLVAPPAGAPVPGFTWSVFRFVLDFVFDDPAIRRIVVEPDIRNHQIHALNRRAGFRYHRAIALPNKTAHLAFCTRSQYRAARDRELAGQPPAALAPWTRTAPDADAAHALATAALAPEVWSAVNAALIRKAIAEFAHELLIEPRLVGTGDGWGRYALAVAAPGAEPVTEYRFRARRLALDTWDIAAGSLEKWVAGAPAPLDALGFVIELAPQIRLSPAMLPVYVEEIASTLRGAAHRRAHQALSAADLVHAGFQDIETAMTEGHPAFVANGGRMGFDAVDYARYAPEAGAPIRVIWLAAHRRRAELTAIDGLVHDELMRQELGPDTVAAFRHALERDGVDPADYLFLPVHPWQWRHKLAIVFAPDLAARDLVYLGPSDDVYRAQQSIRTFFNISRPDRRYVKMALSVLNMGFMRGLSADYMRNTPAINDWIDRVVRSDPYFAATGFEIVREVAAIGYRNPYFELAAARGSAHRKMLAALWRESPVARLGPGQRLMTMAALLHRDRDGIALAPQLILASGLDPDTWLDRYLRCYLAPLLHCLYQHDLVFMPHGENVILVLEDNVPVKALLKDIAEEAAVLDTARDMPEAVQRIRVQVPQALRTLSIFTDVFDCFLRYLAQILVEQAGYPEDRFWRRVARCVAIYRREHPALADKLARDDLFAPTFQRSCLNRLQLANNIQMVDIADPAGSLAIVGTLENPIARFRDVPDSAW